MASPPTTPPPPRGAPPKPAMMLPMRVWDGPVRLFHWTLLVLLLISWTSVEFFNNMRLHMWSGEAILALLLFRIVWGFIGSETARFSHFLGNPFHAVPPLMRMTRREPDTQVGHNAAGGWMVLVMLLALLALVATGMLASDEESFVEGPLNHLVGGAWGAWALAQHRLVFTAIQVMIALHLFAIIGYAVLKRHDLVRPMLSGKKRLPAATPQPRMRSPWLALLVLLAAAVTVWLMVTQL